MWWGGVLFRGYPSRGSNNEGENSRWWQEYGNHQKKKNAGIVCYFCTKISWHIRFWRWSRQEKRGLLMWRGIFAYEEERQREHVGNAGPASGPCVHGWVLVLFRGSLLLVTLLLVQYTLCVFRAVSTIRWSWLLYWTCRRWWSLAMVPRLHVQRGELMWGWSEWSARPRQMAPIRIDGFLPPFVGIWYRFIFRGTLCQLISDRACAATDILPDLGGGYLLYLGQNRTMPGIYLYSLQGKT